MTPESIARVQASYAALSRGPLGLSERFYREMFGAAPHLRALFPADLSVLQGHFESAISLVVRNLSEMDALADSLRDLGAQHVRWRTTPDDYLVAREALVTAVRAHSPTWGPELEQDWRRAITAIIVAMLQGAAVAVAVAAERIAGDVDPGD
jgi:hemoglobin-like flavoprotein